MNKRIDAEHPRIWELDFLRGIMVLCFLAWHLYFTVDAFCINGYYTQLDSYAYVNATDPLHFWFDWKADGVIYANFDLFGLQKYAIRMGVATFFLISGISCTLSRNNLRRALLQLVAAYIVSLFTYVMGMYADDMTLFIRFGVLHCYAYSRLIYLYLFEKRDNRTLLISAVMIILLGWWIAYKEFMSKSMLLLPFGIQQIGVPSTDYWPLFPGLGWLLLGVLLGRTVYCKRQSLIPMWNQKGTHWLQRLGQYSGHIYFFHIFIYTAVFIGIGWIFSLF